MEYSNDSDILADREHFFCLDSDINICFKVAEDRLANVTECPGYTGDNKGVSYGAAGELSLEKGSPET